MVNPFFGMGLPCFVVRWRKGLMHKILFLCCLIILLFNNLSAQNCDYLPGNVTLNASPTTNSPFYTTAYLLINTANDTILQVGLQPHFTNLARGTYAAYAVTYKLRDSIFNLTIGELFENIQSACVDFSVPYTFNVCSPPQLSTLETTNLEVCADGAKINLTNSINFVDNDGLLDTFSIIVSIIESPDPTNDFLDVDLSIFIGLQKEYIAPTLVIRNVRSPMQVQAILRAIHFYTNTGITGPRKITFQVFDGLTESDTLSRKILVTPLPNQPIQIFRKRGDEE